MENLDYYDENGNFLGTESRDYVHENGLWHKTIHCWLYDKAGNIYFQIRTDSNKLYTSASGHVLAGENIKQAFSREVDEELGLKAKVEDAKMVEIIVWKQDKIKNGKPFHDRAFANVYINEISETEKHFNFDLNEVLGLVKVNAKQCLDLLRKEQGNIEGVKYFLENGAVKEKYTPVNFQDFLIADNEIGLIKYGTILQSVIQECK